MELSLGPLRLVIEHRALDGDGGPTLRLYEAAAEQRELLRFDCFEKTPHWHLGPWGPDRISRLDPADDNVAWTLEQLRGDLAGLLSRAGLESDGQIADAAADEALRRVELAMRNPPAELDDLSIDRLRQRTGEKWTRYPDDALAAWVADMDFPVAAPIQRALQRSLDVGDLGYPHNPSSADLPSLFAERAAERWGWQLDPRSVEVLTDVVQGIFIGLLGYSDAGDGIVIQTPIYPPFLGAVQETGRRVTESPLVRGAERYEIDFDQLRAAVDPGSRVLLLCHPHNPTGRAFERAELEGLAELVLERDLVVISDEIHADLVFPGHVHIPFATLGPEIEARTLTLSSASKAFNIAGLRCAVAAFGSADLKRRFLSLPRHARGGIGGPGLAASDAAWRHSQPWLDQVMAYLDENRRLLGRFVRERLPGIVYRAPEATYLAWLDCRALELPEGPYAFFLEKARVAISNGVSFGAPGEGFVRLNFATSRAILTEILERMAKAVDAR
jgi:cystathionine beta-lyase